MGLLSALAEQLELFRLPVPTASPASSHRHLLLGARIVSYDLRRDRRRLTMRIDEHGLHVGAPRSISLGEIESFIQSHTDWVLDKLDTLSRRDARRHLPLFEGAELPVLGRPFRLRLTQGGNRGYWQDDKDELWLAIRPGTELAPLTRRALQRRALEVFRPRLANATARLGVDMPPLSLSSARTRWGSCSERSGIRLNWRLIHLPVELIDYVVAHEAAHLIEMNHGPRFWRQVERLCPEWQSARDALKQQGAALPLL